jgi:hypothetical protein
MYTGSDCDKCPPRSRDGHPGKSRYLSGAAEEILNDLPIAAPGRESFSVSENQHLIALVEGLGGADVGCVDDHGAMNPQE